MPVMPQYTPGLGDALSEAMDTYRGVKRQRTQDAQSKQLFDEQIASAHRATQTQDIQDAQQGIHRLAPGQLPPREVTDNITANIPLPGDALAQAMSTLPHGMGGTGSNAPAPGAAPALSRAGAGALNIPGHPDAPKAGAAADPSSGFQAMMAPLLAGADRGPRYQFGQGYYIDKQPQWQAQDAARANKMQDEFTPMLVQKMMAAQERDRKIQGYVAAGVHPDRAQLYADNPALADNDPTVGKHVAVPKDERLQARIQELVTKNRMSVPEANTQARLEFGETDPLAEHRANRLFDAAHPTRDMGTIDPAVKFGADQGNKVLDDFARDTKDFHQVMGGWDVLNGALKNPSLATPFAITDAYARITNPGALVRPTTMEMIHNMGSLGQRMEKFWSQNKDGQLPPEIVKDFQKTLYNIVREHKNQYDQIREKAILRGKAAGTNVEPYLQDYKVDDPTAPAAGVPAHVQTIDEMIRAGASDDQIKSALLRKVP